MLRTLFLLLMICCTACAAAGTAPAPAAASLPTETAPAAASPSPAFTALPTGTPTGAPTSTSTVTPQPTATITSTPALPALPPYRAEAILPETAKDVREVGLWGKGALLSVDVARAGARAAVGSHIGVRVYDLKDLSEVAFLRTEELYQGLSISGDGRLLAGATYPKQFEKTAQKTVNIWDIDARAQKMSFQAALAVERTVFSPDSSLVAVSMGQPAQTIGIYRAADGSLACKLVGHRQAITGLRFSPDGSRLYTASLDQTVRAWNVAGCVWEWVRETGVRQGGIEISADGQVLTTIKNNEYAQYRVPILSEDNQKVWTWDARDGAPLNRFSAARTNLTQSAPGADGSVIAAGDFDGSLHVLDGSGAEQKSWRGHPSAARFVFLLDGGRLLSAADAELRLWDWANEKLLAETRGYGSTITSMDLSPDGSLLAAVDMDSIKVWDTALGQVTTMLPGLPVHFVQFSADGKSLLVGTGENNFSLISIPEGKRVETVEREYSADAAAVSPDGRYIAIASKTGPVDVYQASPIKRLVTLVDSEKADFVAFSPDGNTLAGVMSSGRILAWSLPDGKKIVSLYKGDQGFLDIAFSRDGSILTTMAIRGYPRLWKTSDWSEYPYKDAEHTVILSYALSPDNRLLAMSRFYFFDKTWRGKNVLWDVAQNRELVLFHLQNDLCNEILFSPDGSRIFAAGGYGVIDVYAVPE